MNPAARGRADTAFGTDTPLLIPGWRLGRGPLVPLAEALAAQWYDLPGYGATLFTTDFAQAIARLGEQLPLRAVVIGWSLGAMVALAAAAHYPERVTGVVAIAGTPSFIARPGWPHGLAPEALAEFRTAIATDEAGMLPRFIGGFNRGEAEAKRLTQAILAAADPPPSLPILLSSLDWLAALDLRPFLAAIACPVLVIHGTVDPLIPFAAGQAIAEGVANGMLYPIEGAAHAPFLSQPKRVIAAISSFAAKCR